MPPRRPTAFEVTWPEEAAAAAEEAKHVARQFDAMNLASSSMVAAVSTNSNSRPTPGKRKADSIDSRDGIQRPTKQSQLTKAAYYVPPRKVTVENKHYRPPGEDLGPEDGATTKPIRILSNFCIFKPTARNELVSLDELDVDDPEGTAGKYAAAGVVLLEEEDEEDYGQEDDGEDGGASPPDAPADHVRLNGVDLCLFDYSHPDAPVFIETDFAFYALRGPSADYVPYFNSFLAPRHVAQTVVMRAKSNLRQNLAAFRLAEAKKYTTDDLLDAVPYIEEAMKEDKGLLRRSPLIQELFKKQASRQVDGSPRLGPCSRRRRPIGTGFLGNPDLALLRPENQSQTQVTQLISQLAKGYFTETIACIGYEPTPPPKVEVERQKKKENYFLKECLAATARRKTIFYPPEGHIKSSIYCKSVELSGKLYQVGDFVVLRKGTYHNVKHPAPPILLSAISPDAQLPDYFWFAHIISINSQRNEAHIQWLEHGSQILLKEMANPRELFLNPLCGDQPLDYIDGKIAVEMIDPVERKKPAETNLANRYFLKFLYDEGDASFTSISEDERQLLNPPMDQKQRSRCFNCERVMHKNNSAEWHLLSGDSIAKHREEADSDGFVYKGHKYHYNDFFLLTNLQTDGAAHIGQITRIQTSKSAREYGSLKIHFRKVGRVARDLQGVQLDDTVPNEHPERHLFLTKETSSVNFNELICPIQVFARDFFVDREEFDRWIGFSPHHYYVSYELPSLDSRPRTDAWAKREEVRQTTLLICGVQSCRSQIYAEQNFLREEAEQDYQCLDLFAGTGAFSHAAGEGSLGCIKPTHAIEITPSAAKTIKKNLGVVTYCQDANVVLRYFVKSHKGHDVPVPKQLFDNKTLLPPPLAPGKMRAIFAGLPWYADILEILRSLSPNSQSHSVLNMYRKAEDHKSNLILTAASYVDFFRPDFFFLENVPGFLKYNLLAQQAGLYRTKGGIEMGGLKLLLRALLDMKYQVRFALLQAGHYGAPQNRIRFFLVAAREGLPLPDMPQPTHNFEVANQLRIKLPYDGNPYIAPIRTTHGTAPHPAVTIQEAIGDLPQFDWRHPNRKDASMELQKLYNQRRRDGIPALVCDREKKQNCGFEGPPEYQFEPWSSYQAEARVRPTTNIQQFTRVLLPKTVERTVTIPLEPKADYRSLPHNLWEWQFSSSASAEGRKLWRGGLYGRLEGDKYFHTTVTNVHPTAKQSKVLHPSCLRMVTVRELARSQGFPDWFVFESINDNVVTLHRQIGNAVPWQVSRALGRELRKALFRAETLRVKEKPLAAEAGGKEAQKGSEEDVDMR